MRDELVRAGTTPRVQSRIVPSHALQAEMSSGVSRGEMLLVDISGYGDSSRRFPVKVILIEPEDLAS